MPADSPPKRGTRSNSTTGITVSEIKNLIEGSENRVIKILKDEIGELNSSITSLKLLLKDLEQKNNELEEKYDKVTVELDLLKKQNLRRDIELSSEIEDRTRRKLNVVVSGIPESSNNPEQYDKEKCVEIFRKLDIAEDCITGVSRVGRRSDENSPRLLRVKFESVTEKVTAVKNAKQLRKFPQFRKVFVNPDRTPLQQRFWRELLFEMRQRRDRGEDVVIFRDRVVRRRDAKNG